MPYHHPNSCLTKVKKDLGWFLHMSISEVEMMIRQVFPDAQVQVADMTGGGDHFEVFIESSKFQGKSLVEQHRMVYSALGSALDGPIHALKITTRERGAE